MSLQFVHKFRLLSCNGQRVPQMWVANMLCQNSRLYIRQRGKLIILPYQTLIPFRSILQCELRLITRECGQRIMAEGRIISSWLPARRGCHESFVCSDENAGGAPSYAQYAIGARIRGRLCHSCGNLLCAGNLYSRAFPLQSTRNPIAMPILPHPGHPLSTLRMWVQNAIS